MEWLKLNLSSPDHFYIFFIIVGFLMFMIEAEGCKVMIFHVDIPGKALENHVLKTEKARDDSHCRTLCFLDDRCISYNFGRSKNNRTNMCELSDSDHKMHPEDLVARFDTIYKGAQNTCNCSKHFICRFNFAQGTHRCECKSGFTGLMCENDIDECASNPCQNGGSCQDQINSYNCTCAAGFTGDNCQTNIDDCTPNSCYNGGTCQDGVNGHYTCLCAAGYHGVRCETNIDECASNPCQNGGLCQDQVNSYNCTCAAGFTGVNCQTNIDDCTGFPCLNGAVCHDHVNSYNCTCVVGFEGTNCETNIDECASNPCQNGGLCQDQVNSYNCICAAGFTGVNCQTNIDECASNPCQNGGSCQDQVNSYNCTCATGFTGVNCLTDIDDCAVNPCMNNGTCVDLVNDYNCSCVVGFSGRNCSTTEEVWLDTSPQVACIGAKDDQFGKFIAPLDGHVKAIKLVYNSGDGLSYVGKTNKGYWGGTILGASILQIFITNVTNYILAPQNVTISKNLVLMMVYRLFGVTNMDPVLLFPHFETPFYVNKDEELRAWFGPDLVDHFEFDNYGTTCAEMKIMYK